MHALKIALRPGPWKNRLAPLALLLVLTGLIQPLTAQRAQTPLPRVHFVATGGTISNRDGGRLSAEELAKSMPGVERYARLSHEQFANVASSELTLDQWVALAKRVNELFAGDKELAGIVVTSGTDTLEETAFFLHLTVRDPRPVVVVGSMRNPSTVGYEGAANLLEGVRVAAEPASRNKGVLVVLNDEINSARNVTKTDALRLQTFRSREYGQLGVVDRDRVVYFNQITQRHNEQVEFDVSKVTTLPRVDVIMVYQGAPADLIKAAVDNGAKGIVIAVAGAGATSGNQSEGLNYAASKGVFIVTSTRTGSGRIAPPRMPEGGSGGGGNFQPTPEQQRRRQFTIAGEDHTPIKARVLLMVALTKTTDRGELQRIFSEY
ncbi:MAG TPA: asparaginase [Vicinamibacterales bacterium]|nr:asparaginase [Vicinamibacterales bacterium]